MSRSRSGRRDGLPQPADDKEPPAAPATKPETTPEARPDPKAAAAKAPEAKGADAPAGTPSVPPAERPARPPSTWRSFTKFLSANTNFVSSFVIGGAGLIATSLYQCNQTEMARQQAQSQQAIAREQADNNWRIERAKILSQNLQTLTARGDDSVEQRYGVLLSLTRGSILEPDVAVSYALELGKSNPEYMSSVLGTIERKDEAHYRRLASAYQPTCAQRYGVTSPLIEQCKADQLAARSAALAGVISDDTEQAVTTTTTGTATAATPPNPAAPSTGGAGPLRLLADEREVHAGLLRLCGVFAPFLQDMYERRQWSAIDSFLGYSAGARLIGTLVLSTLPLETGAAAEHEKLVLFHQQLEDWLQKFLTDSACDADCRVRVVGIMLSQFDKGQRHFAPILRALLKRPHAEASPTIARLNLRLLWCQIDPRDVDLIRDQVLVPLLLGELKPLQAALAAGPQAAPKPAVPDAKLPPGAKPAPPPSPYAGVKIDEPLVEDLLELLALVPEPKAPGEPWKVLSALLGKLPWPRLAALLGERRTAAQNQRKAASQALMPVTVKDPKAPAMLAKKRITFCQVTEDDSEEEVEE